MHPPAPPAFCRVTLLARDRRADVALPADLPVAELVPLLMELLDVPARAPGRPDPWRLSGATGVPLSTGSTLDALGVLDGDVLRFGPAVPPPPTPTFDDPVDALATLGPQRAAGRRGATAVAVGTTFVGALVAAVLLGTAGAEGATAWPAVALAGVAAAGALARAAAAARRIAAHGPDDPPEEDHGPAPPATALVSACCAVPLATAAGWAAVPGPADAGHLLLAVLAGGTAAALGQVAVRAVAPVLLAAVVVAVLVGAAAVLGSRFDVPVAGLCAVTAAVALSVGPLLPRAVLRLARVPRPVVPADARELVAADTGADVLPAAELTERGRLARGQLAGLTSGAAVTAALAVVPAASEGGWAGPAFAAVVVAVLLLRSRGFADVGPARVHLAAGGVSGVVLLALAAASVGASGRLGGALVLLGVAALGAGSLGGLPTGSPVLRRALDVGEAVLTAAAVPLALGVAGVFALVRAL